MGNNRVLSLLSLATKAGKTSAGAFLTERAVKSGNAQIVLIASDASANTKKQFEQMCFYYKIPVFICGNKDILGHSMGKELRSVAAVTDEGFAKKMISILDKSKNKQS